MIEIKGFNFPNMFNSREKTTYVVESLDKIRADVNLLLKEEINKLWFNPNFGTDFDSILFADDVDITRDFIYSFVAEAVKSYVPDVSVKSVTVKVEDRQVKAHIRFSYKAGTVDFGTDFTMEERTYE